MITASTINNEMLNVSSACSSQSLRTGSIVVDGNDAGREFWPFLCWAGQFLLHPWTWNQPPEKETQFFFHICEWLYTWIMHTHITVPCIFYKNILCIIYVPDKILIEWRIGCHFCPPMKCMLWGYPFQPLSCPGTSFCTLVVCKGHPVNIHLCARIYK